MATYVQISAQAPSVVPATSEIVYDKLWLKSLMINAPDPARDAVVRAMLVPCRDVTVDGVPSKEIMPGAQEIPIIINNLFAKGETDADFAAAINAILVQLKKIGVEQGVIAAG